MIPKSQYVCATIFFSVYTKTLLTVMLELDRMKKLRRKACVSFRCSNCLSLSVLSNLSRQKGTAICLMFFRLVSRRSQVHKLSMS